MKIKTLHLGLVICLLMGSLLFAVPANAQATTWPPTDFWNYPYDPTVFDKLSFGLYDYPPSEWDCVWNFGDGTTYNECWVDRAKQYSADGDYTVSVQVTDEFGESVTASRIVSIRTHDVAITKFTVPQNASAGQTRQIVVNVRNTRYPEQVQVELHKNDMVWVGTLIQDIPPRPANRTTSYSFNYTFTAEDARNGKVTFRAMAFILSNGGDDWQVDNDVIALPTRVSR
jgi:hypothetical protein